MGGFLVVLFGMTANKSFELTAVDETASGGIVLKGPLEGRPNDSLGLGIIVSGLSSTHAGYLAATGAMIR